ncbi:9485_t:CDS:2, partial [Entrophospora sp. SA101]
MACLNKLQFLYTLRLRAVFHVLITSRTVVAYTLFKIIRESEEEDFDISTVDIKAVAMSWHSFANPNIKERDDGLGSGQLHRHGRNYIPVDEETLFEIQNKKNVGKKKKSLPLPPSPPQPRSYRDPIPPSKTKPSYRSSPSTSHRPPPPTSTPTSALNYYNQKQTTIPSSTLNSQSDKNPSSPVLQSITNKSTNDNDNNMLESNNNYYNNFNQENNNYCINQQQDYYNHHDSYPMVNPALEQNYSTIPKCVDNHDHGQLLLTINAELEDGHTLTICVHVNDDPADLAKNFCDSLKVTNPLLEPALVALIEEEMDVRL